MTIEQQLQLHEGVRLKPYRDSVGKLTIAYGRNLDDVGISYEEAFMLLRNDIKFHTLSLMKNLPWVSTLSEVRQRVLIDMCFNLGIGKLLQFRATLAAVKTGDYDRAAEQMLKSRWAAQTKTRAKRLAWMMKHDAEPSF